ncbi:hypothetical protein SCP_0603490 [Sparassis crispa]|uniref:Ribonuclease H1 N-terminal domain-containing protein n=1 Tax=Sparassis crispa TaxID=139825 RepID=A0A401GQD6_9APHY|nr:hypothetical protein SCP_0603490 [Sparassis crispa]GBE84370.1 hypothetical protein SCP_0603490 [Sparassis crispa]
MALGDRGMTHPVDNNSEFIMDSDEEDIDLHPVAVAAPTATVAAPIVATPAAAAPVFTAPANTGVLPAVPTAIAPAGPAAPTVVAPPAPAAPVVIAPHAPATPTVTAPGPAIPVSPAAPVVIAPVGVIGLAVPGVPLVAPGFDIPPGFAAASGVDLPYPAQLNNIAPFYCITRGCIIRVYTDWSLVAAYMHGVSGAFCKRHPTYTAAISTFNTALTHGTVQVV